MKCEEILTKLEDYSYGEIKSSENALIAGHLRDCSSCKAAYEVILEDNEKFFGYVSDAEVTPQMWESVRARIGALNPSPVAAPVMAPVTERGGLVGRLNGWIRALSPALAQPTKKNSTEGLMNQDIFTFIEYEP